jgi:Tol biopolymer transport system component
VDNPDIYVKSINAESPRRLTTDAARDFNPRWSPDGQIAFIRTSGNEYEVLTVPVLGNGPERKLFSLGQESELLMDSTPGLVGDGKYIAYTEKTSLKAKTGIALFSPDTGERRTLTSPPEDSYLDNFFSFSPEAASLAFVRMNNPVTADLYVVPVTGGEPKRLTFDDAEFVGIAWSPDGPRDHILLRSRTEPRTLEDPSVRWLAPSIYRWEETCGTLCSFSKRKPPGLYRKVRKRYGYLSGGPLELADQPPAPTRLIASTRHDNNPKFSPDGQKITFESNRSGTFEIWLCDSDGGNPIQLTSMGSAGSPSWSP